MAEKTEVALLADLADGAPVQVKAGEDSVLLVRQGEAVLAVGGTCPHAGAPLAEGVVHDGTVICPWHKAAFCLRTGRVVAPPAVDDLPRFETRVEDGRVFVQRTQAAEAPAKARADSRHFVIVGGGAAGAVAAQTLREEGYAGRITVIDREGRVPYDRTVLSKYWLSGEKGAEKSPLQSQAYYRERDIVRVTARAIRVDPESRVVTCSDGQSFVFDSVLLAAGSVARRPPIAGAHLGGVFTLRSRADAEAILARAERSERAVVLGTSFIGMEVAASLRERGLDVTVVGQDHAPFEKQLGATVGGAFLALHRKRGVAFRLGAEIASIEGDHDARAVVLKDGARLDADMVVMGFGVSPVGGIAECVIARDDGGIEVDAELRACDGVFVAGDGAWFPARGDGDRIRVEHWRVAQQQGRVAALNMLGRGVRFEAVPVFWTIQYMKRLDYIGHAETWDDVVVHGDPEKPEFLAYYVKDGVVRAAVGMDRDRDTAALVALMGMQREWTAEALGERPADLLAGMNGR